MNSTYLVGIGALILAGIFYSESHNLPGVAQRLPVLLIWVVAGLAVLMVVEEVLKQRRLKRQASMPEHNRPSADVDESGGAATLKSARTMESALTDSPGDVAPDAAVPAMPEDDDLPPINWKAAISFSLALLAYVWLIPTAGYIATTIVFMAGVLLFSKTIRPVSAILIALIVTAFVWVVFVWALGLPVPLLPWLN